MFIKVFALSRRHRGTLCGQETHLSAIRENSTNVWNRRRSRTWGTTRRPSVTVHVSVVDWPTTNDLDLDLWPLSTTNLRLQRQPGRVLRLLHSIRQRLLPTQQVDRRDKIRSLHYRGFRTLLCRELFVKHQRVNRCKSGRQLLYGTMHTIDDLHSKTDRQAASLI